MLIPFGFNLLLELTFVLIVQCKSDVLPVQLRSMIIQEYDNILQSLIQADQIFSEAVSVQPEQPEVLQTINTKDFSNYFGFKRRKLNL